KRSFSSALTFFSCEKSSSTPALVAVLPWATTAWTWDLDSRQSRFVFFTQTFWAAVSFEAFAGVDGFLPPGWSSSFGFEWLTFTAGGGVGAGGSGSQAPIAFPPYMIAPA